MSDNPSCSVSTPESASGSNTISQSVPSTSSVTSRHAPDFASSSDVLSEVLTLAQPRPSKKSNRELTVKQYV